jgi:Xaa-Pro dipeptidase
MIAMTIYSNRLGVLRDRLRAEGLDGCALLPGSNFAYYTGQFKFVDLLTTVFVIPAAGASWADRPLLLLPGFEEYTTSKEMPYPADTIAYGRDTSGYAEGFARMAKHADLSARRIGVESTGMRFQEAEALRVAAPGVCLQPIDALLAGIRAIKSADEVETIRRAARLTEDALDRVLAELRPGQTEIELRNQFHRALLDVGADGPGFDSLVVSGPRAALQHAAPSERAIAKGDPILFDVGARLNGYTADITRTVVLGSPSEELTRIYSIVREANAAARQTAKPGVLAEDVDRAAREVIRDGGYSEAFIHGTGHGLGMDVHEPPRIAPGDPTILQPGMVFTIEPGIYLAERLGVRIEDDVAIVRDGHDRLTSFTHDLIVV